MAPRNNLNSGSESIPNRRQASSIVCNPDTSQNETVEWAILDSNMTRTGYARDDARIALANMGAQFKGDISEAKCSFAQKDFEADIVSLDGKK